MALPLYLAMTAAELARCTALPPRLGYMACHFSPYSAGLSGFPPSLPPGAVLLVDDSTPIAGHDPQQIGAQLTKLLSETGASRILLDFQRPGNPETAALVKTLVNDLPCPVGVAEDYAKELTAPVFLPPPPPDVPLSEYLAPWADREKWLDISMEGLSITLTEQGAACQALIEPPENGTPHYDSNLFCHYQIRTTSDRAEFLLYRTAEDLLALLEEAARRGVTLAIGLYQELGNMFSD